MIDNKCNLKLENIWNMIGTFLFYVTHYHYLFNSFETFWILENGKYRSLDCMTMQFHLSSAECNR